MPVESANRIEVRKMEKAEKQILSSAPWDEVKLHGGYSEDVDLSEIYGEKAPAIAKKLLEVLKMEKGLTYAEANASLQIVYKRLKFESNFVKIN